MNFYWGVLAVSCASLSAHPFAYRLHFNVIMACAYSMPYPFTLSFCHTFLDSELL